MWICLQSLPGKILFYGFAFHWRTWVNTWLWITSTVVISCIIQYFCTNVIKYNTELRIFIIGLVVVYLLFGRILVNFSQNQNGEWCYPALQHFGWSETSLLQVWYVISTHCVVLIIFVLAKIKLFQSYVFHFNHSCSLGCDSTRNWYNNRALPI